MLPTEIKLVAPCPTGEPQVHQESRPVQLGPAGEGPNSIVPEPGPWVSDQKGGVSMLYWIGLDSLQPKRQRERK
eukprot:1561280-Pyramimonas_sp.AAC.1